MSSAHHNPSSGIAVYASPVAFFTAVCNPYARGYKA